MKKTKMISALLTFCFLFTLAFPTLTAHADDEIEYDKVYFITDSQEFYGYKANALSAAVSQPDDLITIPLWNYLNPFKELKNQANNIYNSIVIVELQSRMKTPDAYDIDQTLPTEYLSDAFLILKNNNCKIMFISGNDEDIYQADVELLDYVDVHVNVDFIYLLVKAVVTKIELNGDSGGFYFITDNTFSAPSNIDGSFAEKWLLPYFEEVYYENYSQDSSLHANTFYEYLSRDMVINIYGQANGDSTDLFNYLTNQSVSFSYDTNSQFFDNVSRVYMIGRTYSTESNFIWYSMVDSLANALSSDLVFTIGLRGSSQISREFDPHVEYTQIGTTRLMFYGQLTPWDGIYTFYNIVSDFIAGDDMLQYANYSGQCPITYMPILASLDGWIPTHMVKNCYQVGYRSVVGED